MALIGQQQPQVQQQVMQNHNGVMIPQGSPQIRLYAHTTTKNKSFLEMHYYLKSTGRKNNAFMLALIDPGLEHINPHSKDLSLPMKTRIYNECKNNYWYFIREVVRIPVVGSDAKNMPGYELHRGNMAFNFCSTLNLDIFLELPRQTYKTSSAIIRYLWIFNFGTSNSKIGFMHKDHGGAKSNLADLKKIRDALPDYLKMDKLFSKDTKSALKKRTTVETLDHLVNGNSVITFASAKSKAAALTAARGLHLPMLWYDEYAFILNIEIIKNAARPALSKASDTAKQYGKPYGVLITTTPGKLTSDEGKSAFNTKNKSTKFTEAFYDMGYNELIQFLEQNDQSPYVYIKYGYRELGKGEAYVQKQLRDLEGNYVDFRREILLEWANVSENPAFDQQDLEIVRKLVRPPIRKIPLMGGKYELEVYETLENGHIDPPIMGVDVAGGIKRDSSTLTIINSRTTKVAACFNCNFISQVDLARVIYEIVKKWIPNCLIVIENNGGFGRAVVEELKKTEIRKNLYKELKERVIEERIVGGRIDKRKSLEYVYGINNNKQFREEMMELLRERMELHKDKFVSEIIYHELAGLEITRTGRVDHGSNTHDDQVISMMLSLWVWYYGKDLKRYGLNKRTIATDQNVEIVHEEIGEVQTQIGHTFNIETDEKLINIDEKINQLYDNRLTEEEFFNKMREEDRNCVLNYLNSKEGIFDAKYGTNGVIAINQEDRDNMGIPLSVFNDFYK